MTDEETIQKLENRIVELEHENYNIKQSYHAKFTALIFAAKTKEAVTHKWILLCVNHLLKDDEDWWGHGVDD